jgi:hypothetical protein
MDSMNKKALAKEFLIFIGSFLFGFVIVPASLTLILDGNLRALDGFYGVLFADSNGDTFRAWMIVFGPYLLVLLIRATVWSAMHLKGR